jgi:hypothetical protein
MIEAVLEGLLCNRPQLLLQFGFNILCGVKYFPLKLNFHLGEEQEVTGEKGGWGMTIMFLEAKNCCTPEVVCAGTLL